MKNLKSIIVIIALSLLFAACQDNSNPVAAPEKEYKEYVAKVSQSNNNIPTVVILNNTIGVIQWTRIKEGYYKGTLNETFLEDKIFCAIESPIIYEQVNHIKSSGNNEIIILTFEQGSLVDNILSDTSIEIRIYK